MIGIFVDGHQIGTITLTDDSFAHSMANNKIMEARNSQGETVACFSADRGYGTRKPGEPIVPWDPTATEEDLEREALAPGSMTLAEFWKSRGPA